MNPRRRKQQVVTIFDGRVHQVALCRGYQDGLPVFGWGEAPSTLLTRSQLRRAGLRPNGQDPLALLVFRHFKPYRRETVAELYSAELAAPVRGTAEQRRAQVQNALRARRTCHTCGVVVAYFVPTSTRQCWECWDADNGTDFTEAGPVLGVVA